MVNKIVIFIFLTAFYSCNKSDDHFPHINQFTVQILSNGNVKVSCTAESMSLNKVGFSMDTNSYASILRNQQEASRDGDMYYHIYEIENPFVPHYFRAWATNDYGYSKSEFIKLDSVFPAFVVPNCTPSDNTVDWGFISGTQNVTSYYLYDDYYAFNGEFAFQASTTNGYCRFYFGSSPYNGIYNTQSGSPGSKQVRVEYASGSVVHLLSPGHPVYVNLIHHDSLEITFCDAPHSPFGVDILATGRFVVPIND